jgi:hypothetical protein
MTARFGISAATLLLACGSGNTDSVSRTQQAYDTSADLISPATCTQRSGRLLN